MKLSYISTRNVEPVITSCNQNVSDLHIENFGFNCRNKENCLLDNKCLTQACNQEFLEARGVSWNRDTFAVFSPRYS